MIIGSRRNVLREGRNVYQGAKFQIIIDGMGTKDCAENKRNC